MKMKKFSDFLSENIRNYFYTVKLDFRPDHEVMTRIEKALGKYNIVNITAPRSLPIQRVDRDFPGVNSPEVYCFDVEVTYPAPAEFVRHTIAGLGMDLQSVVVLSTEHMERDSEQEAAISANTGDKALLDSDYAKQDNKAVSAETFGTDYNDRLVKNSIGSSDQFIPKELKNRLQGQFTDSREGRTLNDPEFAVGKDSAVGSKKTSKPSIGSFAR